jgi:SAM-dependent methyltransferase
MSSIIYWHPSIYESIMRMLYYPHYDDRFAAIAAQIPSGKEVLDVCCGTCRLYRDNLADSVDYTGVDINPRLPVSDNESVEVLIRDVRSDELPSADYVIMQASLYQFIPDHGDMVDKLLEVAREKVVITEPIRNIANSDIPILSTIVGVLSDPSTGEVSERFTNESFQTFILNEYGNQLEKMELIAGGREMLVILNAR